MPSCGVRAVLPAVVYAVRARASRSRRQVVGGGTRTALVPTSVVRRGVIRATDLLVVAGEVPARNTADGRLRPTLDRRAANRASAITRTGEVPLAVLAVPTESLPRSKVTVARLGPHVARTDVRLTSTLDYRFLGLEFRALFQQDAYCALPRQLLLDCRPWLVAHSSADLLRLEHFGQLWRRGRLRERRLLVFFHVYAAVVAVKVRLVRLPLLCVGGSLRRQCLLFFRLLGGVLQGLGDGHSLCGKFGGRNLVVSQRRVWPCH